MDIVERLKELYRFAAKQKGRDWDEQDEIRHLFKLVFNIGYEAANEIDRLRDDLKHSDEVRESALQSLLSAENEIERLRAALERAADALHDAQALDAWAQARKELEGKTNDTP